MNNINKKRPSILVVEDNHLDILVIKVLLEKHFNLYIVTNGEEAVKAANEFEFDIVLTDINLGNHILDGVKVMKLIRENKKNERLKIFAVTAYAENREYYLESGFNEVFTKPVIKEEIFEFLNETVAESYKFSNVFIRKNNYN